MSGAPAEFLAVLLLIASLAFAVVRPRALPEALVAVPAAVLAVVSGAVPAASALRTLRDIAPTVAFLAAILVLGQLCADAGVFTFLGAQAARVSRGDPRRLLGVVVALAAAVTSVLTLDATVVLLTPVVLATTARLRVRSRPHAYACTRLANSGSLLLPVSNLTNLLAFRASELTFGRFAVLMALPWTLVAAAEWYALRAFFRADLTTAGRAADVDGDAPAPRYALLVLAATVVLFGVGSAVGVSPAWAALAGCVALLAPRAVRGDASARAVVAAASPGFCLFVAALAVVVDAVTRNGLSDVLRHLVPSGGESFVALLGFTMVGALLANLLNNLPATLALVPIATGHPAAVLAVLLGVNIGPNATYPGSLATLLWRRQLPEPHKPSAAQFHAFGLLTVPALLLIAAAALWFALRVVGT